MKALPTPPAPSRVEAGRDLHLNPRAAPGDDQCDINTGTVMWRRM